MIVSILTHEAIAEAPMRAKVIGCPPDGRRRVVWASQVTGALETLTSDGWCVIDGVEDARAHGPIWRGWMHVDTGEVRRELEVQRPKQRQGRR